MIKKGTLVRVKDNASGNIPLISFKKIETFISFKENRGSYGIVLDTVQVPKHDVFYYTLLINQKVVAFITEQVIEAV